MSPLLPLAVISLLSALLAGAPSSYAASRFRCVSTTGSTYILKNWASSWERLKAPVYLPENALIQVQENSSLMIIDKNPTVKGLSSESVTIHIKKPTVFRVDGGLMRQSKIKPIYFAKIPEIDAEALGEEVKDLKGRLNEAWERFAAIFTGNPHSLRSIFEEKSLLERDDVMEIGIESEEIRLVLPPLESEVVSPKLPATVDIVWRNELPYDGEYKIYRWSPGQRATVVASTTSKKYRIQLNSYGDHRIQIRSANGAWRSQKATISVANATSDVVAEKVQVDYPRDRSTMVVDGTKAIVPFVFKEGISGDLVITMGKKRVIDRHFFDGFISIALPAGQYEWYVRYGPQKAEKTRKRSLRVISRRQQPQSLSGKLLEYLKESRGGQLVFESL